jgi:uncharacterized protein YodC (DUF2158 family)
MATMFMKNQEVRLKATVPQGPVQALRMDEDGVVWCLVQWVDAQGRTQSRWFTEAELEAA